MKINYRTHFKGNNSFYKFYFYILLRITNSLQNILILIYNLTIFLILAMNHTTSTINKLKKYLLYLPRGYHIYELDLLMFPRILIFQY